MTTPIPDPAVGALATAATIATERTADALSALVGERLTSATRVLAPNERPPVWRGEDAFSTRFHVQGGEETEFVTIFGMHSIKAVRDLLAPGMGEDAMPLDNVAREVGNICASHFLAAVGDLAHEVLLPTTPELSRGAYGGEPRDKVLFLAEIRAESGATMEGVFGFHPSAKLMEVLRTTLKEDAAP